MKNRTATQKPVADGRWNVRTKGEILNIRKGKGNPSGSRNLGDQVEIGLGKKLKEVKNQTHQWIRRKTKSADREYIDIYILDIFDREPTYQNFILGEIPQFMAFKG